MNRAFVVVLHPDQASGLGLGEGDLVEIQQGGAPVRSRVVIDDRVPMGCARIPAGVAGSETLGDLIGPVTLAKSTDTLV